VSVDSGFKAPAAREAAVARKDLQSAGKNIRAGRLYTIPPGAKKDIFAS